MGWSYGVCSFKMSRPSRSILSGGITVYHNGSVKITGTIGVKKVWSGNGDVCVVYTQKRDIGKHIFKVSGEVEECTKAAK